MSKAPGQQGICQQRRPFNVARIPIADVVDPTIPKRQLISVSASQSPMWSPPPESNRRPHPYHSCCPSPIEEPAQVIVTRVTVRDRQAPPEPARYGTEMAGRGL